MKGWLEQEPHAVMHPHGPVVYREILTTGEKKKKVRLRSVASIPQNQHNGVYTQLARRHQLRINGNYVNYACL
jgi:hypothetical protein